MSLLDNASLLLTPNAYKEGKLYSVIPSNGNGDFTATRATTATRVNSAGLVDLVPYNLLTYSEQFDNAVWPKVNSSVSANTTTAPNGTTTADSLTPNATLDQHRIDQTPTSSAGPQTFSIYAKANGYGFVGLRIGLVGAMYNLTTGATSNISAGFTASTQNIGDGWFRCILTKTSGATNDICRVNVSDGTSQAPNFSGNGTDGIFLWGAQLVEGTSARDYLRTETRLNIPRVDFSLGGCPNILLEPQRTNLALQSSSFDNATWVKQNTSVTANATTSPSGIQDADKIVEDVLLISHNIFSNITTVSGSVYNVSFYAKADERGYIQYNNAQNTSFANFDLINGVVGTSSGVTNEQIQSVGNGWYRCSLNITATSTGTAAWYRISIVPSASATRLQSYLGDGTSGLFIWGAQWELGAYATSYIPTTTASVTRNGDLVSLSSATSLIGQTEGTAFVDFNWSGPKPETNSILTLLSNSSNYITFNIRSSAISVPNTISIVRAKTGESSVTLATGATLTVGRIKVALTYSLANNQIKIFVNGSLYMSSTLNYMPSMSQVLVGANQLSAGILADGVYQTALFPTPLTDAQCIALTQ